MKHLYNSRVEKTLNANQKLILHHIFRVGTAYFSKNNITFALNKSQRVARKMRKVSHCEIGGDDLKD